MTEERQTTDEWDLAHGWRSAPSVQLPTDWVQALWCAFLRFEGGQWARKEPARLKSPWEKVSLEQIAEFAVVFFVQWRHDCQRVHGVTFDTQPYTRAARVDAVLDVLERGEAWAVGKIALRELR